MEFSRGQERANAWVHFVGIAIGAVAVPLLIYLVIRAPSTSVWEVFGAALYGLGFMMVFTFSSLYHSFSNPRIKASLEIWDHIAIYFMIAGTYTPFAMAYAEWKDRALILTVIWSIALAGSVLKIFFTGRFRILSMLIYVVMGLLIVAAPESFKSSIPSAQLSWIIAGAVTYIAGLIFYLGAFFRHHHAVWHLFVLGGAICHYIGILKIFL